ncbi:hypothetical protein QTN47_19405 [Danxiaibacter flavus]|uniref:Dual OB-containing domain-containing protein n=1 Tax=Danxiaibacter flavus TaxID=3049108 RepID=A0ABV3ZIF7_9BACT|nr:hypothetical protein QNM32_19415 [Chitinophagaceae bacterium DXS]
MKKRVLLLAVSCKTGGLCPGGIDLGDPSKWIRIVKDDGRAGAVQGYEIDFGKPLDIIEFEGRSMPQGKQIENWVIDNNSCKKKESYGPDQTKEVLDWAYQQYSYNDFWGNYKAYLNEEEFNAIDVPSESILKVSDIDIYRNNNDKWKTDFNWHKARFKIKGVSMTDPDFYNNGSVHIDNAYIVTSIPKEIDDWINHSTGEKQAYKFVSKIYKI